MKAHILVVDDEEEICDYIRDILQEEGHRVNQAFCGEDVPKIIGDGNFDIAFVDLKLSTSVSGLDVIRFLKGAFPKIKIVAMTGFVDIHLRRQTDNLGVSFFLEKPFNPGDVLGVVSKLLS